MATYHSLVRGTPSLTIDATWLRPGLRLAVGLSGGADSVALLRVLAGASAGLGLVLHAAHLHHGLRGEEADGDLSFSRDLATRLALPFHEARVDTTAEARAASGKAAETIEEAARRLRYGWFRSLMAAGVVDAVATAHTLDDQAETVLAKLLRGAWTEGLSGIHPVVNFAEGRIMRPLLQTRRTEIESYLNSLDQDWREDSSNRHMAYTRNRIRHELLPTLETWNPKLREHMAQMAELAREEESWWDAEVERLAGQLLLPGKPVRGGGRAASGELAIEVLRLTELPVVVQRRLLRFAAQRLGVAPDFEATEALRELATTGRAGQKAELAQGLRAERTHRELRMTVGALSEVARELPIYEVAVPGEVEAPAFGIRMRISVNSGATKTQSGALLEEAGPRIAQLRAWRPGDRVRLKHSGGPAKVKEVLERLKISGDARVTWPVLELQREIVWMQGVTVENGQGIECLAMPFV